MAKYKFQKGEEVHFRYKNAQRQVVRGYGKVVSRKGRFYNIEVCDGLVVKIYCNKVRKNLLAESVIPMSKTACESFLKEEIPTPENPFCLPKEEKTEETQEGKEYRLIKKIGYSGGLMYAIQIKKHFLGLSWWSYVTTDSGLLNDIALYRDFREAQEVAEEICKGRVIKQYDR